MLLELHHLLGTVPPHPMHVIQAPLHHLHHRAIRAWLPCRGAQEGWLREFDFRTSVGPMGARPVGGI